MIEYLCEFLGTLILILVILQSSKYEEYAPFIIGTALIIGLILFGKTSGGHFNPAVSMTMYVKGTLSMG